MSGDHMSEDWCNSYVGVVVSVDFIANIPLITMYIRILLISMFMVANQNNHLHQCYYILLLTEALLLFLQEIEKLSLRLISGPDDLTNKVSELQHCFII